MPQYDITVCLLTMACEIGFNKCSLLNICSKCGVKDPSWSEIRHFVKFLDLQLQSCEESVFTDPTFVGDVMAGLKGFVVKFMIRMSRVSVVIMLRIKYIAYEHIMSI